MSGHFKDREHLVRMGALFAGGLVIFVVARGLLVPAGFGQYGHFRAGALADNRAHQLRFAGRAACADCHDDVVKSRVGSKHASIGCEACHGPLAAHAADPDTQKPQLPDAAVLCVRCHQANVARPAAFPQVDPREHGDGQRCTECHKPHHPEP